VTRDGLFQTVFRWAKNIERLLVPRPPWRPEAEFAYYHIEPSELAEQLARQKTWQQNGHKTGRRLLHALGLRDSAPLHSLRILEVGAGECMLAQALLSAGAGSVWAVDAVPKQLWAAAKSAQSPSLHCLIANGLDLPFSDGSFDLVVANLVLHHVRPLSDLLNEISRVLAPGGRFCALEPAPLCGLLVHEKTSENEAPLWPSTVTRALSQSGFQRVEHEYVWLRFLTHRLGPFSPSYRVTSQKPGQQPATFGLRRTLVESTLPGLLLDDGCRFLPLVEQQIRDLSEQVRKENLVPL